METNSILEVKNLTKIYGSNKSFFGLNNKRITAVDKVSFSVNRGETFGLIGESGSGKSTVGRLLLRLIDPTSGEIIFNQQRITKLSTIEMAPIRQKLQIVFQDSGSAFNPRKTIGEQVAYPLRKFKIYNHSADINKEVRKILNVVGLRDDFTNRYPHELSGGQRQRAGIARSLILKPEFLVLDEPVSALDVSIKAQIINLLMELQKEFKLTYLFIAHNLDLVAYLCDRIGVMSKGNLVELGETSTIFKNPQHQITKSLLGSILTLEGSLGNVQKNYGT